MPLERSHVFFDIAVGGRHIGHMVMELFDDKVPRTAENFRKLCTGEAGMGETTKAPLHYKNTIFHRVVAGFIIQGGDFSNFNGTGGESVFGGRFEDESFEVKHNKRGLLSMANTNEAHSNGSQFFITCDANCAHLDGKNVAFGELISGFDVLDVIENQRTVNDRPVQQVTIVDCGIEKRPKRGNTKDKKEKTTSRRRGYSSVSSSGMDTDSSDDVSKTDQRHVQRNSTKTRHTRTAARHHNESDSDSDRGARSRRTTARRSHKRAERYSSDFEDERHTARHPRDRRIVNFTDSDSEGRHRTNRRRNRRVSESSDSEVERRHDRRDRERERRDRDRMLRERERKRPAPPPRGPAARGQPREFQRESKVTPSRPRDNDGSRQREPLHLSKPGDLPTNNPDRENKTVRGRGNFTFGGMKSMVADTVSDSTAHLSRQPVQGHCDRTTREYEAPSREPRGRGAHTDSSTAPGSEQRTFSRTADTSRLMRYRSGSR